MTELVQFLITQGPWAVLSAIALYAYWHERKARSEEVKATSMTVLRLIARYEGRKADSVPPDDEWDVPTKVARRMMHSVDNTLSDDRDPDLDKLLKSYVLAKNGKNPR